MDGSSDGLTTQVVLLCPDCGAHWYDGAEEPRCAYPAHRDRHQRFEVHRHRTVVTLPDGTSLTAVSFDPADPYGRDPLPPPDHGLYLDARWQPTWPHDHVDWPDFGVPADPAALVTALRSLLDRARGGARVELGCLGAHGRTGTALATLAVLTGLPPTDAIPWTRTTYCPEAIETPGQETLITTLAL